MHGNTPAAAPWFRLLLLLSFFSCFSFAQKKTCGPSTIAPNELVRRVVDNELKTEQQDHSQWSFRLEIQKPNGQREVDEVVETRDGDLRRPILINGQALNAQQRQKVDQRMQQLVRDPGPLRKSRREEDQDTARSQRLLKMQPAAFDFKYEQRRGNLVQLNFSPNPNFHPPTREAEVFHAMQGSLWVDDKQARVEEITGRLMREVKFGGGLLGYLDQGGTFQVKQAEVAPGYWELTLLKVQMKGKALFFKTIGVHQNYTRSDFKQAPDDLTLAKAAEMLRNQAAAAQNQAKTDRL